MKASDEWGTPRALARRLVSEFRLNLDLCATQENAVTYFFVGPPEYKSPPPKGEGRDACHAVCRDAIKVEWMTVSPSWRCWMNPPYSNPLPWAEMAVEAMKRGHIVVALLKCDMYTELWRKCVHGIAREVRFIPRLRHVGAPQVANFPQAIVVWDRISLRDGTHYTYMDLTPQERGMRQ